MSMRLAVSRLLLFPGQAGHTVRQRRPPGGQVHDQRPERRRRLGGGVQGRGLRGAGAPAYAALVLAGPALTTPNHTAAAPRHAHIIYCNFCTDS